MFEGDFSQFPLIYPPVNMPPLNVDQLPPYPGQHERDLQEDGDGGQDEGQLVGGGQALHEG